MHNSFETTTLNQVETYISSLEESLNFEMEANMIKELKNYNKSSLMNDSLKFTENNAPLALIPLKEAKKKSIEKKQKVAAAVSRSVKKATEMRHSFFPSWPYDHERTKRFASRNGFHQVVSDESDCYCTISVSWRQRELRVSCDRFGMVEKIAHRNTRWLSATIKRSGKETGHDVRAYLDTRAPLDDDEAVLETVVQYLEGRSVFNENFSKQILAKKSDDVELSKTPLIPEMFNFNWRFQAIRYITPVVKFMNAENDVLVNYFSC